MNLLQRHHLEQNGIRPSEVREEVWGPTAWEWTLAGLFAVLVTLCCPWWMELPGAGRKEESEAELQRQARALKAKLDADRSKKGAA